MKSAAFATWPALWNCPSRLLPLLILASAGFVPQVASASPTSCSSLEPAIDLSLLLAQGCTNVDKTFEGFVVGGNPTNDTIPSAGQISLLGLGSLAGNDLGIRLADASGASNDDWSVDTSDPADNLSWSSTIDFVLTIDPSALYTLTGLSLDVGNLTMSNISAGAGAAFTLQLCRSGSIGSCSLGDLTTLQIGPATTGNPLLISASFAATTQAAVRLTYSLDLGTNDGARNAALDFVDIQFTQQSAVPEPGTFGVAGLALIGMRAFARRRKT